MNRVIRRECARADRNGREFSLVLFRVRSDVRHAVSVHRLARTILRRARLTDEVGWFSDRYLCVLLPDTPPSGARAFAEGVCDLIAGRAPRPLAIVYSYPEHWVGSDAAKDLAPEEAQGLPRGDRFAEAVEVGSVAKSDGSRNPLATGSGMRRHRGLDGSAGGRHSTSGSDPVDGSSVDGSPLDGRADNGNDGHGRGNGEARSQLVLSRGDLLPFFSAGFSRGIDEGLPVESLSDVLVYPMPAWKRLLDFIGAVALLILTSPLMGLAALAIKLSSPGPVMFKQRRAGLGGRPFTIYKFRTMVTDAEARKRELRKFSEQDGPAFKLKNDPRVTAVGRFLRKTSIDELPQLWNVVRGEMSLVGPRPLPCDESDACLQWQRRRLDVTPGLTCIWQVKGRSSVTFAEWVRMDVEYIRKRTLLHDLSILLQTVPAVLLRKGAR